MRRLPAFTTIVLIVVSTVAVGAAEPTQAERDRYDKMVAGAVHYLRTTGQADDGSFSKVAGPGVTSLVTTGILVHGVSPDDPVAAKALRYLEKFRQEDGGIYRTGSVYKNYETCLALLCFNAANEDGRYDKLIKRATAFVKGLQWDEGEGKIKSDFAYGGQGYGKHKRADLSNTSFFIDALKASGVGEDDEALQKALQFISRCQNLETEHNTTPFPAKNPDGGFYYTADNGGYSQAGETADGGLRSYASMTYAGLKSMIFAGVDPKDPRVVAATTWVSKHYDLKSNPGMGTAGLYYYYHTFAKALDALGQKTFTDSKGAKHDWRAELVGELARRQQKNGSWLNDENPRWMEGDANLVTGYALLALQYCDPAKSSSK